MVIGLDEVGRGSWAGPLVFAGVHLAENFEYFDLLRDSKIITFKKRNFLAEAIKSSSLYKIVEIDNKFIDQYGLTLASKKACLEILDSIYSSSVSKVILDGNVNYFKDTKYESTINCIVKADATYPSVMAASIVAKDYRDNLMKDLANEYIGYDFHNNYGYGTKKHADALNKLGITKIHRKSFKPIRDMQ